MISILREPARRWRKPAPAGTALDPEQPEKLRERSDERVLLLGAAPGLPTTGQYGGQPGPAGMYLDQQSGLMLPQGTELATPGRRIGAFFLAIPLVIITLGIGYLIWGLIVWPNGQNPALQVLGMRCFRPEDNRVAGFWWMALREIVAGGPRGR